MSTGTPARTSAVDRLDHVVIPTRDAAAARRRWAELGFTVTEHGVQHYGSTAYRYWLVPFERTFVELVDADRPAGSEPDYYSRFLDRRPGGVTLPVLRCPDAAAAAEEARARGADVTPATAGGRSITLPSGEAAEVRFEVAMLPNRRAPYLSMALGQHHTPELVYGVPEWQRHANGVTALLGLTIVAHEPAAWADWYAAALGPAAVQLDGDGDDAALVVAVGESRVALRSPAAAAERFPVPLPDLPDELGPQPLALHLASDDLDAAAAALAGSAVATATGPRGDLVVADEVTGVVLAVSASG